MTESYRFWLSSWFRLPDALSQAPFYQDRTIRIVAGYGAGSVDDAWTRMIARYLVKYIPGNPNIVVQNMPGAGTMIATARLRRLSNHCTSSLKRTTLKKSSRLRQRCPISKPML